MHVGVPTSTWQSRNSFRQTQSKVPRQPRRWVNVIRCSRMHAHHVTHGKHSRRLNRRTQCQQRARQTLRAHTGFMWCSCLKMQREVRSWEYCGCSYAAGGPRNRACPLLAVYVAGRKHTINRCMAALAHCLRLPTKAGLPQGGMLWFPDSAQAGAEITARCPRIGIQGASLLCCVALDK